ncbi:MAG: DUF3307 domain-containing protein [Bacteroidota bacterium]|nr:DUF3307 domain-containing protein [Bacteroidota bacterium]
MNSINYFTLEQGNILIRLIAAHFLADFAFQSTKMVENKKWISKEMILHVSIVYLCTALLSGWWLGALLISGLHYLIDGLKIEAKKKEKGTELQRFLLDQIMHIITIIGVWMLNFSLFSNVLKAIVLPFNDYNISLIILGYLILIGPVGYIIKFATLGMQTKNTSNGIINDTKVNNEHGGRMIGIFERIIILTFVLLGQYEAIGFLITGKSIIRFASQNEDIKSEYVLVGTMMSYAISILTGVIIKWLLI